MARPLARALRALLLALPCLALAAVAGAQTHHWVDPVTGDDAHSGAAPDAAWRTITHALAVAPAGDVVHLAPGVYSAGTGEVWPLPITGVELVGDAGSAQTLLQGGWLQAQGFDPWYRLKLSGVTLRDGETGIEIYRWHPYKVALDLRDVVILDMAAFGIRADAWGAHVEDTECHARLDGVVVERTVAEGILITASEWNEDVSLEASLRGCEVRSAGFHGIWLYASTGGGVATSSALLERCRVLDSGRHGVYVGPHATVRNCLVAGSAWSGIVGGPDILVDRCTVVDSGDSALYAGPELVTVRRSILARNALPPDVPPDALTAEHVCTDTGAPLPGVGNFVADPLFRDPDAGDYELLFGSPCVDADAPDGPRGALDLEGRPRDVDGDLDSVPRADLGALELHPLALQGSGALGTLLRLEFSGPLGGSARVFFAPAPLVEPPAATPFGALALDRPQVVVLATVPTAPWPPGVLEVAVPDDPALVGQSWSFQALAGTGGPAPPWALTNAVSVVLTP